MSIFVVNNLVSIFSGVIGPGGRTGSTGVQGRLGNTGATGQNGATGRQGMTGTKHIIYGPSFEGCMCVYVYVCECICVYRILKKWVGYN